MELQIAHAKKVISTIALKSDRAILFYSTGKDSIALLELMYPHFKEIVLVYMYLIPGLDHVERYFTFSKKKYKNISILQIPHWTLSYIQSEGIFCKPKKNIKTVKLVDIDKKVREKTGIDYSFYGMKKADGMNRNLMLSQYELHAISGTNKVYPLSLWRKAHVLSYIKHFNLPMPIEYNKNKVSQGLGFNIDCFLYLKEKFPNDLNKILSAYPLSEKILIDYANKVSKI